MKKLSFKKLFVPSLYLVAVLSVIGCITLTISGISKYLDEKKDFTYSVNGLIENNVQKVQGEETTNTNSSSIIRPYKSDTVSVGRYFYDFEGEAGNQENAIIYFQNTYMQNSGVDYISDNVFDVISVLDGKVKSVETDDTLGNIIKIEHQKDIYTIYQGVDKVSVKEGDTIIQGQVIATSGTSEINSNFKTSLHFEVYYKGSLIDPENFYALNLNDL